MTVLAESARAVVDSGRLGHVVTLNADGSPQVSCVWIAMDGDELVMMHTAGHVKVRNLRRDPRVVVSVESGEYSEGGPTPRSSSIWWSTARPRSSREPPRTWPR